MPQVQVGTKGLTQDQVKEVQKVVDNVLVARLKIPMAQIHYVDTLDPLHMQLDPTLREKTAPKWLRLVRRQINACQTIATAKYIN